MTEQKKDAMCNENCCKKMSCCTGTSQRSSLGRILLGVIILSAMFFWGVKFGMGDMDRGMYGKGGRGEKSGCMMGESKQGGCGMKDSGCGMKDSGCGMKDSGCGMKDSGCGMKQEDVMQIPTGEVVASGDAQPTAAPEEEIIEVGSETGTILE